jgi:hypothetical protein
MRHLLLSAIFAAGLLVPIAELHAQSAANAPVVTATCKDGSAFSGTTRSDACKGHGGVNSWGPNTESGLAKYKLGVPGPDLHTNTPAAPPEHYPVPAPR